ncbi:MAG: shikimate kinase [Phocaeicola sp.]
MERIFLIGYMGSGKTTLGKAFAHSCGLTFIDLDWHIEERYRKSVSQLFAERGEEGFREIERLMLHEVGEFEDVVISTGGGAPCFFDNMAYMNQMGKSVYLEVSPQRLFKRLKVAKQQRPLLANKTDKELMDFICEALQKRESFYKQAHYTFRGEELENKKEIQGSVACLKLELRRKKE